MVLIHINLVISLLKISMHIKLLIMELDTELIENHPMEVYLHHNIQEMHGSTKVGHKNTKQVQIN